MSDQFVPSGELLISVGRKENHFLEQSLIELGPPQTTPLDGTNGNTMGDNRVSIPEPKP